MEDLLKIEIYVATHKNSFFPQDEGYLPIFSAEKNKSKNKFLLDNTGDNISYLNDSFCELTSHYWIYKNTFSDFVGLNHYRRFFSFKSDFCQSYYKYDENGSIIVKDGDKIASSKDIMESLKEFDIIVGSKWNLGSLAKHQYRDCHNIDDLFSLRHIVKDISPSFIDAYDFFWNECCEMIPCNMICCSRDIFNEYSSWLFSILLEMNKSKFYMGYDNYQKRVFGFLSERLLNIWILKNRERFSIQFRDIVTI